MSLAFKWGLSKGYYCAVSIAEHINFNACDKVKRVI